MSQLGPDDFRGFFIELYGKDKDGKPIEPFPWQERLARRVCGDAEPSAQPWPRCIALPTAAGKTACIDIAVFALACQASRTPEKRTAPRRIFFVVDRRVVVDQAYDHAEELAEKLGKANGGVLGRVAGALKRIAGCECEWTCKCRPLDVYALRGGMYRESAWVRSPLQPTVITSTVDQVGSRLLFRGYGVSDSSKPLHAALVGNDSLILLDEAHCARPFDQTMSLVRKYRDWTDKPEDRLALPLHFVTMTATPGKEILDDEERRRKEQPRSASLIFEPDEKDRNPKGLLGKRIAAKKPARLVIADKAKGAKWRDGLVTELVAQAKRLQTGNVRAVGVIVNRVATARDIARALGEPRRKALEEADKEADAATRESRRQQAINETPDVILLTGRMRPVDRDAIMAKIEPLLSKNSNREGGETKPTFVVATQTIEVGADLDFHALVTECAGLDALRQRFGRLNRVAARDKAEAVIVVCEDQAKPVDEEAKADPVYGNSLAKTWQWLSEHALIVTPNPTEPPESGDEPRAKKGRKKGKGSDSPASASAAKIIDFGVAALDALLNDPNTKRNDLAALNAPSPDAAVLLPAHLDMWCQTSPRPVPDPDLSYFLHGPQRGEPEVQVVFRADLKWDETKSREENEELWAEIVSLCPPSSSEALSVRLRDFTRWLRGEATDETSSDVEGQRVEDSSEADDENADSTPARRRALRWRGPDARETSVVRGGERATPNDLFVVPITTNDQKIEAAFLGDFPINDDGTPRITDAGDEAFQRSRDKAIVRLVPALYQVEPIKTDAGASEDADAPSDPDAQIARIVKSLVARSNDAADAESVTEKDVRDALEKIAAVESNKLEARREWLVEAIKALLNEKKNRLDIEPHPTGGIVLTGKRRLHRFDPTFIEPEDSWEAASDRPYPLADHCRDVASVAGTNAERSGVNKAHAAIKLAGELHDAGKADPRFQAWLHGGNASRAAACATLYAKSVVPMRSRRELLAFRDRAGFPAGARHELASVRLAEGDGALPADFDATQRDLVLHLIAAHHGYCRPFAPVIEDPRPQELAFNHNGHPLRTSSATGLERLDSGVAERFWMLTRRYGWWGLPYLEALLRLADWACSKPGEARESSSDGRASIAAAAQETMR